MPTSRRARPGRRRSRAGPGGRSPAVPERDHLALVHHWTSSLTVITISMSCSMSRNVMPPRRAAPPCDRAARGRVSGSRPPSARRAAPSTARSSGRARTRAACAARPRANRRNRALAASPKVSSEAAAAPRRARFGSRRDRPGPLIEQQQMFAGLPRRCEQHVVHDGHAASRTRVSWNVRTRPSLAMRGAPCR